MAEPCIHGNLCRAYLKKYDYAGWGWGVWATRMSCIYSQTCPDGCEFYEPIRKHVCKRCGNEISRKDKFCKSCGRKLWEA